MNDDTIRRQAAITQLSHNKNKGDDEWELAVENDIQTIWKLPPAQPEELDTLIKALEAEHKKLREMQAKQRTGKCMWCERLKERNLRIEYYWIDEEGCTASFSEPHIVATGIAKFCPNCGAKLTEGDAE
jgi:hypothetical protein